jgi:micrococcal nuclease
MYEYNVTVDRVVDGDTVDLMVDLGFDTWKAVRCRMYGINAPESRTRDLAEKKLGLAAKDRLIELLTVENLKLVSHGVGKYGRCLGEIFVGDNPISINHQLVEEGHGVEYHGGKR